MSISSLHLISNQLYMYILEKNMNLTINPPNDSAIEIFNGPDLLLEEQREQLQPIMNRIRDLSEVTFSKIAFPTLKFCFKNLKKKPYLKSSLKIIALLAYLNLLGLGILTIGSSGVLLSSADYSNVISVDFANDITNAAAALCLMTDFPAFTLGIYLLIIKKGYIKAVRELTDAGFHSSLNEDLTPELHEKLYQWHISQLQDLGVDNFYLKPDPFSQTGQLHLALAPQLAKIDKEIKKGVSIKDVRRNCLDGFKKTSFPKKIAKITVFSISACIIGLAFFLIFENYVLVAKTPVNDLFSGNKTNQYNEAFYLTQLGGVFSSVTAIALSLYILFFVCLRNPYKKTKREKIDAAFIHNTPLELSANMRNELYRIKEIKLKKL